MKIEPEILCSGIICMMYDEHPLGDASRVDSILMFFVF